jgi:(1->4)-alpha-D-glucan 1-alpha-D-glucosylmutase
MSTTAVPTSTYRLQLGPGLDLSTVADLVPHLERLGVGHLYLSPFLQAAPDATHGYAVVDHSRVDDRLGGEAGYRRLVESTTAARLGIVADLVPNHMAVSLPSNRWFWEVLEHGPDSRFAGYFDVDWDPPESSTRNQVLMPILGDHYGREVEAGAIRIVHEDGDFRVRYHDHVLPASPRSVASLVAAAAEPSGSDRLGSVARRLMSLPTSVTDEAGRNSRQTEVDALHDAISDLLEDPDLRAAVDEVVESVNHDAEALDDFLDLQHYRLARWRVADQELGYRRFFDIDDLIGLRVEDQEVFADSHRRILQSVAAGEVDGLRIDHPDGLRRPGEYLRRLRAAAPSAWIVVEKILEGDESLPTEWPVDGTSGYEFLNDVTALFVDREAEPALTDLWHEVSGSEEQWEKVAVSAKRQVLAEVLAADLNRLTNVFVTLVEGRRRYRDFTRAELSGALAETLIAFDVYRTYVTEKGHAREEDRRRIAGAIERARTGAPDLDPELFDLLQSVLVADLDGEPEAELRMRFQQLSGPVMAKGVEDTAFYRYLRLAALCEVGGDPGRFGWADVDDFHRRRRLTQERWPTSMLALSTHDTKRSEDVRARLAVLSEIPDRWAEAVRRWQRMVPRPDMVDGNTEYLIYQTLVGAFPIPADRLLPYLEKATKEAKLHTSWTDPDRTYDAAVADHARTLLGHPGFTADLEEFLKPVVAAGRINSLAQKTIQFTTPGVPDVYQGTELWDLSLVDPDNRRPVDHALRQRLLGSLGSDPDPAAVLERMDEGLPKLWVVHALAGLRRRRTEAFGAAGDYLPLTARGGAAPHVVAFARGEEVVTAVPRLTVHLQRQGGWGDTTLELPPGEWHHLFGGTTHSGTVAVGELFARFHVAVLERR